MLDIVVPYEQNRKEEIIMVSVLDLLSWGENGELRFDVSGGIRALVIERFDSTVDKMFLLVGVEGSFWDVEVDFQHKKVCVKSERSCSSHTSVSLLNWERLSWMPRAIVVSVGSYGKCALFVCLESPEKAVGVRIFKDFLRANFFAYSGDWLYGVTRQKKPGHPLICRKQSSEEEPFDPALDLASEERSSEGLREWLRRHK